MCSSQRVLPRLFLVQEEKKQEFGGGGGWSRRPQGGGGEKMLKVEDEHARNEFLSLPYP